MLVTLICEDRLYRVRLPEKVKGRYWMEDQERELSDPGRELFSIEGNDGVWSISSGNNIQIYTDGYLRRIPAVCLETEKIYEVQLSGNRAGYIFTEAYTRNRCCFRKYMVKQNAAFHIGRNPENQIIIDNPYISPVHARITLMNDVWSIADNDSKNGIYINGKRLHGHIRLYPGDVACLMGVRIVFGHHFFALNNPDEKVTINTGLATAYEPEPAAVYTAPKLPEGSFYYRSPKFDRELPLLELKIDPPPAAQQTEEMSMMLTLVPSMLMGTASFSSGLIALTTAVGSGEGIARAIPTFAMSVAMLTGMVIFPFITKGVEKKRRREREKERCSKYLRYLGYVKEEIDRAASAQQEVLNETYPPMLHQLRGRDFFETVMWSRVTGQKDFLTLRVGSGNVPLAAELAFPGKRFTLDEDEMREAVDRLSGERHMVFGVPIVYSLVEHRVSGLVGSPQAVERALHNMLLQIGALHSYDEVKLVFLCDEVRLKDYEYVRWMPHIWDNKFKMRFLAANLQEVRSLSAYLLREFEKCKETGGKGFPHYVMISVSKILSDASAFLTEFLRETDSGSFSYLAVYDAFKNLPKECTLVLNLNGVQGTMLDYGEKAFPSNFVPDQVAKEEAAHAFRRISAHRLDIQGGKYELPEMLTFLEMLRVGKYEYLNILSRWRNSNPVVSLRAPVGVDSDGELFYLDIHERAHGPHGLIAGMTGSGKSEFIITYILSLAVHYSPEDVVFILIDYKGGDLTGAFDGLPHLAGVITNLDGAAINRSLLSIQSELKRRQRIFNEARSAADEGTMDIYKYQKLYRNGVVSEAVPHLLIISDEFAELKSQQPEFMDQLISTARIGRSLGVHLILATQKPSGVVNDQIWANSRFKVCLKVQDRSDSMEMLKRPDAAELAETGRFYLQVGYNELFELGQSAWCGAPYLPSETLLEETDDRVQLIGNQGTVLEEARSQKKAATADLGKKQIVEIVRYVGQVAREEGMEARPLWLPELAEGIAVEVLEEKYHYRKDVALNPILGELDDPFNQEQRLLTLPLTEKGNAVCYGGTGSGKEEFLAAILYSLCHTYGSGEVNLYVLDFGAETLRMFGGAPQVGGIAGSGEDEKLANLFAFLERETARRRKRFSKTGGDYLAYRRQGGTEEAAIVVIIHEYANFAEQYAHLDEKATSMTRDCTRYGIYFVITNLSQSGISYRMQQNFSQVYALQMNDQTDYLTILGRTGGVYPSRRLGRGICRGEDGAVYEFQTACWVAGAGNAWQKAGAFCKSLREREKHLAKPIPTVPKAVYRRHLSGQKISFSHLPIGLHMVTAETVCLDLRKQNVMQVFAMDGQELAPFAEGLTELIRETDGMEVYVADPGKMLGAGGMDAEHYADAELEDWVVRLFWLTVKRHNAWKSGDKMEAEGGPQVVVLILGLSRVRGMLSEDGQDKLRLILEKASGKFGLSCWVFDDSVSAGSYCREPWYSGDGIWIGGGVEDQMRLRVNRRGLAVPAEPGFADGFLIGRSKAQPVRLLTGEHSEMEGEEDDDE